MSGGTVRVPTARRASAANRVPARTPSHSEAFRRPTARRAALRPEMRHQRILSAFNEREDSRTGRNPTTTKSLFNPHDIRISGKTGGFSSSDLFSKSPADNGSNGIAATDLTDRNPIFFKAPDFGCLFF